MSDKITFEWEITTKHIKKVSLKNLVGREVLYKGEELGVINDQLEIVWDDGEPATLIDSKIGRAVIKTSQILGVRGAGLSDYRGRRKTMSCTLYAYKDGEIQKPVVIDWFVDSGHVNDNIYARVSVTSDNMAKVYHGMSNDVGNSRDMQAASMAFGKISDGCSELKCTTRSDIEAVTRFIAFREGFYGATHIEWTHGT